MHGNLAGSRVEFQVHTMAVRDHLHCSLLHLERIVGQTNNINFMESRIIDQLA